MKKISWILTSIVIATVLVSCGPNHDDTGLEFAPNMYESVGYEPFTQTKKNNLNANGMNMRLPVAGTVSRRNYQTKFDSSATDLMIYNIDKDDIETAEQVLVNPIKKTEQSLAEGKVLYARYCQHCHGETGDGAGLVAEQYKGVPNYKADAYLNMNDGHIFHVITHGKGRMWPHASQVTPEERWKIVHYVHKLQEG